MGCCTAEWGPYEGHPSGAGSELTDLLCECLAALPASRLRTCSDALQSWAAAHADEDARRIERERAQTARQKIKMAALAKLTEEERRILGVLE